VRLFDTWNENIDSECTEKTILRGDELIFFFLRSFCVFVCVRACVCLRVCALNISAGLIPLENKNAIETYLVIYA